MNGFAICDHELYEVFCDLIAMSIDWNCVKVIIVA